MAVKITQLTQKTDTVQHDPIFQRKISSHLSYGINFLTVQLFFFLLGIQDS